MSAELAGLAGLFLFAAVWELAGMRGSSTAKRLISSPRAGRLDEAVFGARLGLEDEQVGPVPDTGAAPYLSTVLVTRTRGKRGERL